MADSPEQVTNMNLRLYADCLERYYAAEFEFMENPTIDTMYRYHLATDRYAALRDELRRSLRIADALDPDRTGDATPNG